MTIKCVEKKNHAHKLNNCASWPVYYTHQLANNPNTQRQTHSDILRHQNTISSVRLARVNAIKCCDDWMTHRKGRTGGATTIQL